MLLAIDIGNTETVFGFFINRKIRHRLRVFTQGAKTEDEWALILFEKARMDNIDLNSIKQAIIGSVVPQLTERLKNMLYNNWKIAAKQVGTHLPLGIKIHYKNPAEVGADRIANAVAVKELYTTPAIVIDLGTATTFDIISKEGDYLGGVISPGLETSLFGLLIVAFT